MHRVNDVFTVSLRFSSPLIILPFTVIGFYFALLLPVAISLNSTVKWFGFCPFLRSTLKSWEAEKDFNQSELNYTDSRSLIANW